MSEVFADCVHILITTAQSAAGGSRL